jgi:hypothetical protein
LQFSYRLTNRLGAALFSGSPDFYDRIKGAARRWLRHAGAQPQRSLGSLVPLARHTAAQKTAGENGQFVVLSIL